MAVMMAVLTVFIVPMPTARVASPRHRGKQQRDTESSDRQIYRWADTATAVHDVLPDGKLNLRFRPR